MFFGFMRLSKFIKLGCFLIIFFIFTQATPGYSKDVRVGVINVQAAVSGTKEWKREFSAFKTKFNKEKMSISVKEKQLKKMLEDLTKQGMVLNPELKKKKEETLLKKKKDLNKTFDSSSDEDSGSDDDDAVVFNGAEVAVDLEAEALDRTLLVDESAEAMFNSPVLGRRESSSSVSNGDVRTNVSPALRRPEIADTSLEAGEEEENQVDQQVEEEINEQIVEEVLEEVLQVVVQEDAGNPESEAEKEREKERNT